jgi:hypothetical protein
VDIEHVGAGSERVIQMDLSLGVATLPDELAPRLLNKASAIFLSFWIFRRVTLGRRPALHIAA